MDVSTVEMTCSFCGTPRRFVGRMIAGPPPDRPVICDACARDLYTKVGNIAPAGSNAVCAFCRKGEEQRHWFRRWFVPLVTQPGGMSICMRCLSLARGILAERTASHVPNQ